MKTPSSRVPSRFDELSQFENVNTLWNFTRSRHLSSPFTRSLSLLLSTDVSPSHESHSADFPFSRVQGLVFKFQQRLHAHCSLSLLLRDDACPFFPLFLFFFHSPFRLSSSRFNPLCDACWRYAFVVIASWFFASPLFRKMVASLNGFSFFFFFTFNAWIPWIVGLSRARGKFGLEEFRVQS